MIPIATAPPQPRSMDHSRWIHEATLRFGDQIGDWKFQCAFCKRVYTVREFAVAGGEVGLAPHWCIGRVNGKGHRFFVDGVLDVYPHGCDGAADGLFVSGFVVVRETMPVPVMPFAPGAIDPANHRADEAAQQEGEKSCGSR